MTDSTTEAPAEILYVATSIFNPENTEIRYKLYQDFKAYITSFSNVVLITLEISFKEAPFRVTTEEDCNNIQIRTNDILWYKENSLNIIFKRLPRNAKVAYLDADIAFQNTNWVKYTLNALDQFKFVQMFESCNSLGPNGEILSAEYSFVYRWLNKMDSPSRRGRSGLAWAAKVETLENIGWLLDWDIVGAADWIHAFAVTNQIHYGHSAEQKKNQSYYDLVQQHVNGNVGYIKGIVLHFFHGYPSDRGYGTRGRILKDNGFDPDVDIDYREDGLIYFTMDKPKMKQEIIEHFRSKKEHGAGDILPITTASPKV